MICRPITLRAPTNRYVNPEKKEIDVTTPDSQWWDVSWNPLVGCTPCSPACDHCWAEAVDKRFRGGKGFDGAGPKCHPEVLDKLEHWRKARRVFVCDMSDIGHEKNDIGELCHIFDAMDDCPRHTYCLLTKRPNNLRHFLYGGHNGGHWHYMREGTPLPQNWWAGVTAENQEWADRRIPILKQIQAAVLFGSFEPLLGPVRDGNGWKWSDLQWAIIGAETGPGRRLCDTHWITDIVQQCHAAKVPVFVKAIHYHGTGKLPIVVKDINQISNQLGYAPEELRQFPERRPSC